MLYVETENKFDMLGCVSPVKELWCFNVRVIRLWTVYSITEPDHLDSLEMVLIDVKGTKIHASIAHNLLFLFRHQIYEGNVYKMSDLMVAPESDKIGLSLSTIRDVCGYGPDHEFLVDVAGLVTRRSAERECIRDGKPTKEVVLKIIDNSGECECALFGSYVDEFQSLIDRSGGGLPVVVIQFAKIKLVQGIISIQSYLNATRIFVNPSIPEIASFKERLGIVGVVSIGPHTRPSIEEDFLTWNPPISIANLRETTKEGVYVVGGIVDGLVDPEKWWYAACSCNASVSANSGAYYCHDCVKHVSKMIPRFKVKLRIEDGSGQGVFVVSDGAMHDLLGKQCHELLALHEGRNSGCYPPELDLLRGSKLLLKVEKTHTDGYVISESSFRVERICNDLSTIDAFDSPFLNNHSESGSESDDEE
ncbi:hypothetical protein P8452_58156 [Trifolium repens]|nr:hypothetical protein P8452_58046 [Trifolium repens]WJX74509.1 hypothetical protein P8452_58156 [Trifolium repens]